MKRLKDKIKIGIVGENPDNDAKPLAILLKKAAQENVIFTTLLKNLKGSHLDNEGKFHRMLHEELANEKPQHIILMRDLDGLPDETEKIKQKEDWFQKANQAINGCGIFFLAIYELEALLLSDLPNLNLYYKMAVKDSRNPLFIEKPKEKLQGYTAKTQKGKYGENDASGIAEQLDFHTIYKNHKGERSFQSFVDQLIELRLVSI